jgi:photosystem II stability/assembly factor-like uncharacterized protein
VQRSTAGSIYATTTDGKNWHESRPVVVQGYDAAHTTYSLPTFFSPSSGVMEVTVRRGTTAHALVYRTSNGGAQWRYAAQSPCAMYAPAGPGTLDAVDADTWWVMAPYAPGGANELWETCATNDSGQTWIRSKPPVHRQAGDELSAADGRTAVVSVGGEVADIYLTTDAHTCKPLHLPS